MIKYSILVDGQKMPEANVRLYIKILRDRVAHPRKYEHVVNVPGLQVCKQILSTIDGKKQSIC